MKPKSVTLIRARKGTKVKLLPPRDQGPLVTTSIRLPGPLVDLLDDIGDYGGYSRNEIFFEFLSFAVQEWRAQNPEFVPRDPAQPKPKRGKRKPKP